MNIVAKISFHLCPLGYPGLTRTVPICQIRVRPKGLHNFAFYILNFDFPSHLPLMSLLAHTYVPYNSLYKRRGVSITIEDSLQIAPFFAKQTQFPKSQMNVNPYNRTHYENRSNSTLGENKPNSNPICQTVELMQSLYLQRIMKKNAETGYEKTKPKQTQSNLS